MCNSKSHSSNYVVYTHTHFNSGTTTDSLIKHVPTLLPTMSRPGCTIRVMCSVTVEVRAVLTEELYTESGSAGVLSSLRSCYSTEYEETGTPPAH